jgi:hypothetical protein
MWLVAAVLALFASFIGCGGGGDSAPAATAPGAPSSLIANAGDNSVTLSWSPAAGATSYNTYRGTAPGVTKANGTKVSGVQSPNVVSGLTNGTPYYFVVTAVNAAGESAESAEVSATPVAPGAGFTQADGTGTWDGIQFSMGSEIGWTRVGATIDGSGSITATYVLDSTGNTTLPAPGSFTWIISGTGVVTEGGANGDPDFHGQMSSNKLLVIGKKGGGGTSAGVMVFRKRTGTTFTSADLANKTFTYHQLLSGADNTWERGAGTTNASSVVTLTSIVTPSGDQTPGEAGPLAVNSAGIVTGSSDSMFYGLMTDDKKVIFVIQTRDIGVYGFMVITITGQTYAQADLAGVANFITIRNSFPNPSWSYGTYSIDATGNGTYPTYTDSVGGATPANFSRVLSASGVVTDPADATYHGQLSYNKDLLVRTNTNAFGRYGLAIGFK